MIPMLSMPHPLAIPPQAHCSSTSNSPAVAPSMFRTRISAMFPRCDRSVTNPPITVFGLGTPRCTDCVGWWCVTPGHRGSFCGVPGHKPGGCSAPVSLWVILGVPASSPRGHHLVSFRMFRGFPPPVHPGNTATRTRRLTSSLNRCCVFPDISVIIALAVCIAVCTQVRSRWAPTSFRGLC
jgi:hypothetical protein